MYIAVLRSPAGNLYARSYFNDQMALGFRLPGIWTGQALLMPYDTDKYHIVWTNGLSRDEIEQAYAREFRRENMKDE